MKLLLALGALLLLAGCGNDAGDRAIDPAGPPPGATPTTGIPSWSHGEVSTRTLATVMDTGSPELCLGPVAESYPPQCRGIPLRGWEWADQHGMFERSGDTRWGEFIVTGTFDGSTMTVSGAIPAAAYDPAAPEPDLPKPDGGAPDPQARHEAMAKLGHDPLPGALGVHPSPAGVVVDVVFDDGTLQDRVDAAYGAGVVVVRSMLVPVNY